MTHLRSKSFFEQLLRRCSDGEFVAVFAAPPCSTFSVARFFKSIPGPPPVRDRDHILGFPKQPPSRLCEAATANLLVSRTTALILAASSAGAELCIENLADRGDPDSRLFMDARHGPIWLLPDILSLEKSLQAEFITFPMCSFGAPVQKYTTLMVNKY